jgi:hypothetical protein
MLTLRLVSLPNLHEPIKFNPACRTKDLDTVPRMYDTIRHYQLRYARLSTALDIAIEYENNALETKALPETVLYQT